MSAPHPLCQLVKNYFVRIVFVENREIGKCLYTNRDWCSECGEDSGEGLYCESCGVERPHFKSKVRYCVFEKKYVKYVPDVNKASGFTIPISAVYKYETETEDEYEDVKSGEPLETETETETETVKSDEPLETDDDDLFKALEAEANEDKDDLFEYIAKKANEM